ncbi:hypothetical protein [Microbulbifer sp. SAOS-129_SWC]|uniref:hypothetical protein n=1 Tax=Microbulbifer sp. SAOS-129_SWC TaxID=3145235 RepID=UPI0032164DFF
MSISTEASRLCYLLIALLVFQAAVTFFDSHEQRQDMATHVAPHHLDVADDGVAIVAGSIVAQVASDLAGDAGDDHGQEFCHHCCHCHSFGFVGLPGHSEQAQVSGTAVTRAARSPFLPSIDSSALYRPPIARV